MKKEVLLLIDGQTVKASFATKDHYYELSILRISNTSWSPYLRTQTKEWKEVSPDCFHWNMYLVDELVLTLILKNDKDVRMLKKPIDMDKVMRMRDKIYQQIDEEFGFKYKVEERGVY